jgi:hypothetical protein
MTTRERRPTTGRFYGHTGASIDAIPSSVFAQSAPEIPGEADDGENFGVALAAGNLGRTAQADLAIGVGRDSVGGTLAGSVNVLYGSTDGILVTGSQRWSQDSPGIVERAEQPDHFGSALAIADFGRSSHADLAVGAPCEKVAEAACAGGVNVIFGTRGGLSAKGNRFWSQNSPGVAGTAEQNDVFGLALTAANFGKSGRADLAIGSWETIGTQSFAGAVEVLYGSYAGLTAAGSQAWSQAKKGVDTQPASYENFGQALGAGNFGRGGYADLAIGIPGEAFDDYEAAGAVELLYGTADGLSVRNDDFLQQDDISSSDGPEPSDHFGWSLAPRPSNYGVYWFE